MKTAKFAIWERFDENVINSDTNKESTSHSSVTTKTDGLDDENDLPIVSTLNEKSEYLDEITSSVWNEWSYEYMTFSYTTTRELLKEEIQYNIRDFDIPLVYILYKPKQNKLIGFCFIENEDSDIMKWLTPWLANLFLYKEFLF